MSFIQKINISSRVQEAVKWLNRKFTQRKIEKRVSIETRHALINENKKLNLRKHSSYSAESPVRKDIRLYF